MFIHPVPLERLAEIYPPNYYSFAQSQDSIVHRIKTWLDKRYFRPLLKKVPGDSLSALDVGGGAGWELNVLKQADKRISYTQVVDLDTDAEKLANANGHQYFCGRIEDFTSEKKFDVILMLNLIEHVANPLAVLEQARTLLSPSGIILIKTPNIDSWDARLFRNKNWGGFHCPRHWTLFTKESLSGLVEKAGLKVLQANYTQGAPFWTTSVLFALERLGWVSITRQRPVVYHPLFGVLSAGFAAFDFVRGRFAKTSQMFFILGNKR
jgi:2-polyprenyl-3-methyl-5-hydroxy-6-metoxy-1,4-benzoquinol methylase